MIESSPLMKQPALSSDDGLHLKGEGSIVPRSINEPQYKLLFCERTFPDI